MTIFVKIELSRHRTVFQSVYSCQTRDSAIMLTLPAQNKVVLLSIFFLYSYVAKKYFM